MRKSLGISHELWKELKTLSLNNEKPITDIIKSSLSFESKFKPLIAEVGLMKKDDVFRLDFPNKVITLRVEDVFKTEN